MIGIFWVAKTIVPKYIGVTTDINFECFVATCPSSVFVPRPFVEIYRGNPI